VTCEKEVMPSEYPPFFKAGFGRLNYILSRFSCNFQLYFFTSKYSINQLAIFSQLTGISQ